MTTPHTVLRHGHLLVGDRWLTGQDIGVRDGRIAAIAPAGELHAPLEIDAGGGYVLPGLIDAHVHPGQGGMEMNQCDLTEERGARQFVAAIAGYASAHPDEPWIRGGGWHMDAFPGGTPTAAAIDVVVPDRPVYLPNRDHHSAWVNTRALQLAGIDAGTPDPADGRIERDECGNPTGALHEGAMGLVARHLPPTSEREIEAGLLAAQDHLFSLGITGWQDALVGTGLGMPDTLGAYCRLVADGRLAARVTAALWWDRERGEDQVEDLLARRERAATAGLDAGTVKVMQDGVCETFTAALLSPYLDASGTVTGNDGLSFVDPDRLRRYVTRLDAEGFQVHVHALGDRAVREALDAVEAARAANGPLGRRHHLAHLQVVHPADVPRFRALDVTANAQMLWACHDRQMVELTLPFLDARARAQQYVFASLRDAGARLAAGSDWPVSTPDPFAAMQVAVTREPPPGEDGAGYGPLLAAQSLTVGDAVRAYTVGSAYVCRRDDAGTIAVGNVADFTVIDRDPFAAEPEAIAETRATMTIVGGEVRFAR